MSPKDKTDPATKKGSKPKAAPKPKAKTKAPEKDAFVECRVCGNRFEDYLDLKGASRICPRCGNLEEDNAFTVEPLTAV